VGAVVNSDPHIVILAAGAGRNMKTSGLKVLTPVFYRPMIHYVLDAAMAIPHRSLRVVVGAEERKVREACRDYAELQYSRQETPLGTADAVRAVEASLIGQEGDVLILYADCVLVTPGTLHGLLAAHAESGAGCTVAAAAAADRGGELGLFNAEQTAKPAAGAAGAYCFRLAGFFEALRSLAPGGAQREFRLEDAAAALAAGGTKTAEYAFDDPMEAMDIDDLYELWRVESVLRGRFHRSLMLKGVILRDPATTQIDPASRIGRDVVIEGGVTVMNSALEPGVYVESGCRIVDSEVAANSRIKQGTRVEQSRVGRHCVVGPYAHLRPDTHLADDVRIGNFVEIKNSSIGTGTKVSHLSYIGDAAVGRNVNVGCGFITCNFDGGPVKQRTIIEDGVFIGSDSQAIAPVTVGAGSFVATGTSVTEDVPPDSFVISRGRQVTKPGYAKKYGRGKTPPVRPLP
jgi:bifunctional UDP-N-acetylglucosamine pyrophosphorylase/glucosamine-1-phosphate N-acetyltransferase